MEYILSKVMCGVRHLDPSQCAIFTNNISDQTTGIKEAMLWARARDITPHAVLVGQVEIDCVWQGSVQGTSALL